MSNSTCPKPNLSVKHVVTLFEEVQNRYINKLISIDEKHISIDERHKVNKHFFFIIKYSIFRKRPVLHIPM
jgi:hypothetical protein